MNASATTTTTPLRRLASALRSKTVWLGRLLFFDWRGEFSLGKCAMVFGLVNVWTIMWLSVAWVAYVTLSSQMAEAAPLASAIGTAVGAVLSSQLLLVGGQYFAKIWGSKSSETETPPGDSASAADPPAPVTPEQAVAEADASETVETVEEYPHAAQ